MIVNLIAKNINDNENDIQMYSDPTKLLLTSWCFSVKVGHIGPSVFPRLEGQDGSVLTSAK
jgi:hypothetical protein